MLEAIAINVCCFEFIGQSLCMNRDFALAITKITWRALEKISPVFRDDPDIMSEALKLNPQCFRDFAGLSLRKNKEFVAKIADENWQNLLHADRSITDDLIFMTPFLEKDPHAIEAAGATIRDNEDVMLKIVSRKGCLLAFASDRLKKDKRMIEAAGLAKPD
jgi:hypothetical protein